MNSFFSVFSQHLNSYIEIAQDNHNGATLMFLKLNLNVFPEKINHYFFLLHCNSFQF